MRVLQPEEPALGVYERVLVAPAYPIRLLLLTER